MHLLAATLDVCSSGATAECISDHENLFLTDLNRLTSVSLDSLKDDLYVTVKSGLCRKLASLLIAL